MRRILVAPVVFLLGACQPQQPPNAAAPAAPQGSIDLPAGAPAHRYDAAIKPVDETRTARKAEVVRAAPARPPANALTEREKQAIARWDREEAALSNDAPPLGLRPPPRTRIALAMPTDSSLPRPTSERAAPVTRNDAALPPPIERPAPVAVEPAKASEAPPPSPPAVLPPPAPPPGAQPAPAVSAAPAPPVESTPPTRMAAATPPPIPAEKPLPRPSGEPAATVMFERHSADLSEGDRLLLGRFVKDAKARRLRQILLYGFASDGDPVEARKLALARVLAVHACLIDLGLRADIEIGDFSQASEAAPDRVDVMLRY